MSSKNYELNAPGDSSAFAMMAADGESTVFFFVHFFFIVHSLHNITPINNPNTSQAIFDWRYGMLLAHYKNNIVFRRVSAYK